MLVPYKWGERGRPVGRTENCQINDIHTQKGKRPPTHPPKPPSPHPRMSLSELPSTGGGAGRSKPQLRSTHPEMLGGGRRGKERGREAGQQMGPRCGSPTRPAPLPDGMQRLGRGQGPSPHTPRIQGRDTLTLTHTHPTHMHTHTPVCIHVPDAQAHPQTHIV